METTTHMAQTTAFVWIVSIKPVAEILYCCAVCQVFCLLHISVWIEVCVCVCVIRDVINTGFTKQNEGDEPDRRYEIQCKCKRRKREMKKSSYSQLQVSCKFDFPADKKAITN